MGFLAGVGPKVLIWSGASLRFTPRLPSLFDWWPGRSCSDVPAASGSSCNTNEATDKVRPLLAGSKRDNKTPSQKAPQTVKSDEIQCHILCTHSDLEQNPKGVQHCMFFFIVNFTKYDTWIKYKPTNTRTHNKHQVERRGTFLSCALWTGQWLSWLWLWKP